MTIVQTLVFGVVTGSYDAAAIATLVAAAADSNEGEAIRHKLREVSGPPGVEVDDLGEALDLVGKGEDVNYEGASGPVDVDETGSATTSFAILQVKNGKWVPVEYYSADDLEEEARAAG